MAVMNLQTLQERLEDGETLDRPSQLTLVRTCRSLADRNRALEAQVKRLAAAMPIGKLRDLLGV